jgi:hypothetical protein
LRKKRWIAPTAEVNKSSKTALTVFKTEGLDKIIFAEIVTSALVNELERRWLAFGLPPKRYVALKMRGEGMGVCASRRVLDKSHSTILRWQERMSRQESEWLPAAPEEGDVALEQEELYTHVRARTFSPVSP